MRRLSGFLLIGVFLLSGCAATAEPSEVTEQPTEAPNTVACADFETTTADLANRLVKGSDNSNAEEFMETMSSMRGRFDEAALSATGDVKERIGTLVDNLPAKVHMLLIDHETYFEDVNSVDRACKADGSPINPTIWG